MENTKQVKNVLRTLKALKTNAKKMREADLITEEEAIKIRTIATNALIKYGKEV